MQHQTAGINSTQIRSPSGAWGP